MKKPKKKKKLLARPGNGKCRIRGKKTFEVQMLLSANSNVLWEETDKSNRLASELLANGQAKPKFVVFLPVINLRRKNKVETHVESLFQECRCASI